MNKLSFYFGWLTALLLLAGHAAGEQSLNSIQAIRQLTSEAAAKNLPVELDSQVVWVDPLQRGFFIYDGHKGLYIRPKEPLPLARHLVPGDKIQLSGVTAKGGFNPSIQDAQWTRTGHAPLPPGKNYSGNQHFSPQLDCDWVTVSGRLASMTVFDKQQYIICHLIRNNSLDIDVQIAYSPESEQRVKELMLEWVNINAVAGTVYNQRRQATGRIFYANSARDFERTITDEIRAQKGATCKIHELMQRDMNHIWVVNSSGTITYVGEHVLYLRGEICSLKVTAADTKGLETGDRLYVEGFIDPQPVSPAFWAREWNVIEKGTAPTPTKFTPGKTLDTDRNYDLVEVDALLIEVGQSFGMTGNKSNARKRPTLLCRTGNRLFEARFPEGVDMPNELVPGTRLRLTGICNLIRNPEIRWRLDINEFWIQLRDAADIKILVPAPWWTPKRMLWISGTALGMAALFLIWVVALRKTVDWQTDIIRTKVARETILDERQRIARELHDNLDQGLTGAAMHLQGCRKFLKKQFEKSKEFLTAGIDAIHTHDSGFQADWNAQLIETQNAEETSLKGLKAVQDMLTHCGEESRSHILDLRGGVLERMDLPAALQETLMPLAEECGAELSVTAEGPPRRFKLVAERNIMLIAKESATNAARHGSPSAIQVTLHFNPESFSLEILDNGCGFIENELSLAGHFGLQGIRERAKKLGGEICIESIPGKGTSIQVQLSSTAAWELNES